MLLLVLDTKDQVSSLGLSLHLSQSFRHLVCPSIGPLEVLKIVVQHTPATVKCIAAFWCVHTCKYVTYFELVILII